MSFQSSHPIRLPNQLPKPHCLIMSKDKYMPSIRSKSSNVTSSDDLDSSDQVKTKLTRGHLSLCSPKYVEGQLRE